MEEAIVLIECTCPVYDYHGKPTGKMQTVVSHGVGEETLKNYILPQEPAHFFKWAWLHGNKVIFPD